MRNRRAVMSVGLLCALTACSTGRMAEFAYDAQSGRRALREYSKFYDAGDWLDEGKLGLQIAIIHEKKVVPVLYDLQKGLDAVGVPGALGKDDQIASGVITFYLMNLELQNRSLRLLRVTSGTRELTLNGAKNIVAGARSQTRIDLGLVPILNYGTEVQLDVEYELNGVTNAKTLVLKRRTDREMEQYFSRSGRPPYPWYQAPHYPFRPPLFQSKL